MRERGAFYDKRKYGIHLSVRKEKQDETIPLWSTEIYT